MKLVIQTLFCSLLVTQICFAQWFWQNPLPQGNKLNDVFFTDSNNGTAVGECGMILHTTNGGNDWIIQESGTNFNLRGVNFQNENAGWVVGGNGAYFEGDGIILRTIDGGNTWTSHFIDSIMLSDVCFSDINTGWVVGNYGKIFKTTDGGSTWNQQINPAPYYTYLNDVCFVDSNTGWVVGKYSDYDLILKTEDGGINWIEQNSGSPHANTDLRDVCFTDVNNGWISGYGINNAHWRGIIFKTTDGGMTWNHQFINESNGLNGICFANSDLGWAVGGDYYDSVIFRTTDAGDTWEQQASNTSKGLNDIFVLNINEAWIVGNVGTIRKTTDSGANWISQNSETKNLNDVVFIDKANGWAVGDAGTVLKTTNGGATWNMQSTVGKNTLIAVYFNDENNGWILSNRDFSDTSTIYHTTDGGDTWTSQITLPSIFMTDMFFLDASIGFAVGIINFFETSIFLKTTNGGLTWDAQSDTLIDFQRVQFIDENTGFILSYVIDGWFALYHIYKTEDGGNTWDLKLATSLFGAGEIYFKDKMNGIALGSKVYRTTDGGETWSDSVSFPGINLRNIYGSMDQVTAVGLSGGIFQSTDFGETWNTQISGTGNHLESVFFVDQHNGWAVGSNGTIIHTTNGGVSFVEENTNKETPTNHLLSQNYPNPFNPSTKIRYSVTQTSQVQIKVFDVLGNEIETLVNEEKPVGTYELNWNAASAAGRLPSGVYFYQIKARDFVETKKMVLIK